MILNDDIVGICENVEKESNRIKTIYFQFIFDDNHFSSGIEIKLHQKYWFYYSCIWAINIFRLLV